MAILFDLDGTLLDTANDLLNSLNMLLKENNKKSVKLDEMKACLGKGTVESIMKSFGVSKDDKAVPELRKRLFEIYRKNLCLTTDFFPGIESVLNFIYNRGLNWGIVTNRLEAFTFPLLDQIGLNNFNTVVCGDTTDKSKPDPKPLLYACNNMQVKPEECIYIGDTETDIIAGNAAKMKTVAVKFGYAPDRSKIANWGADYIAEDANDIQNVIEKYYG